MEIFKQLNKLGYKHYIDLTIDELDKLPIDNIEKRIEHSLVIDWLREKYGIYILIMPCRIPSNEIKYYIFKGKLKWDWNELYNTYEETREQAILEALTGLLDH